MNMRKVVAILIAVVSVILLMGRAYAGLVCWIDGGSKRSIVTKVGKHGEFFSLYRAGEIDEAIRCCLACLAPKGSKIIITNQGFLSHTIRVLDGEEKGCIGDIPAEYVKNCM